MEEAKSLNDDQTRHLANERGGRARAPSELPMQIGPEQQKVLALQQGRVNGKGLRGADTGAVEGEGERTEYYEVAGSPRARLTLVAKVARISGALVAILILVLAATRGYRYYKLSPDELYSEAFLPYELPVSVNDTAVARSSIVRFYRSQQFDSVIRRAKKQVILSPAETLVTGVSYLLADDPFWAISPLRRLSEGRDTQLIAEAHFYLALAYLKNKDYDYALTVINRIRRTHNHKYAAQFPDEMIEKVEMLKWR